MTYSYTNNSASTVVYRNFIALRILDMSQNCGVECRFGSFDNSPIPIDVRGFDFVIDWTLCSKIILFNPMQNNAVISISAFDTGVCP